MANYTWRIPQKHYTPVMRLLNEAAWATKRKQTARLQALREKIQAHPAFTTFPRGAVLGQDTIEIEEVKTVLSFSTHPANPVRP